MATWPSVADGGSGTVIASNGAYYTVRFWATFSDAEKTGAIEDTSAYQSGSLVKLNFNVWPIKSDSTNEWTPALNPGYLVKHRDSGDYYVWVGDNGTTTASAPWESSTDSWVNLGQSN